MCEDVYKSDKENWKNYWNWKKNRNEKRHQLEVKHGFDCYSDDTQFLTANGWKDYDDIIEGDELATFDSEHKVEYQPFYERFESLYTGNMYHFNGVHQDVYVTANHMMYNKEWSRRSGVDKSDWRLTQAANLPFDFKTLATVEPKVNLQIFPEGCYKGELDILDYLRLMGWFVSDGTCQFRDGKLKCVTISQSKSASRLTQTMTKLRNSGKYQCSHYETPIVREGKNHPEHTWSFTGDVARNLYNDCGHGSAIKRIPNWVFFLTKRMMETLITGLLQGDGTEKLQKDTFIYYTMNKDLAGDVQRLALLCGYQSSVWGPYKSESKFGTVFMYQVHINKDPKKEKINCKSTITRVPVVNHRVVCFSVKNSTLITRRNGKVALHGNCKHGMHHKV